MSSNEILEMFGKPKNVSQSVCGTATGNPWTCTTWEYGEHGWGDSFTFSGESENLILNNFSFNLKETPSADVYMTKEEIERILEVSQGHYFQSLFILAINTGMRRGENCRALLGQGEFFNRTH